MRSIEVTEVPYWFDVIQMTGRCTASRPPDPRRLRDRAARRLRAEREATPPNTTDPCGPIVSNRSSWLGYRHDASASPLIVEECAGIDAGPRARLEGQDGRHRDVTIATWIADRCNRPWSANNTIVGIDPVIDHSSHRLVGSIRPIGGAAAT